MNKTWKPVAAGILNIIGGAGGLFFGGLAWITLGILAVAGGICALSRKNWGFSLAGAICAIFLPAGCPFSWRSLKMSSTVNKAGLRINAGPAIAILLQPPD